VLTCKIFVSVYVGWANEEEEEDLYSMKFHFEEGCALLCACLCQCLCLFLVLCLTYHELFTNADGMADTEFFFFLFRPVSRARCSFVLGSLQLF
jgi:hypothetical protein